MKSLEIYLLENYDKGQTEFRLVCSVDGYDTKIMIHPFDVDGETVDYIVDDNSLTEDA